jgi:hypothetical protein
MSSVEIYENQLLLILVFFIFKVRWNTSTCTGIKYGINCVLQVQPPSAIFCSHCTAALITWLRSVAISYIFHLSATKSTPFSQFNTIFNISFTSNEKKKNTRTLCAGMRNVSCDFVLGKEIVKYLFHTAYKTTGLRSVQAKSLKSSAVTLCSVQYKIYLLYYEGN